MLFAKLPLGFSVDVRSKRTIVPQKVPTKNLLDEHGNFLDLRRLVDEDNDAYFKRLSSVLPLRASSTQRGLVHGITRELGLEEKIALRIIPTSDPLGGWHPPSPRVEVTATKIILYDAYYSADNYTIDMEVDIFDHEDVYLMEHVINKINTSENFIAELGPHMTGEELAAGLLPDDSYFLILNAIVPSASYFFLPHENIIAESLSFTERSVFRISRPLETDVQSEGDYWVNPERGLIKTHLVPDGSGQARYYYRQFPMHVRWSPIIVYSMRDEEYLDRLFEEEPTGFGFSERGVVSYEGSLVYKQIFDRSPCLWGK